jgi:hypothetical protein
MKCNCDSCLCGGKLGQGLKRGSTCLYYGTKNNKKRCRIFNNNINEDIYNEMKTILGSDEQAFNKYMEIKKYLYKKPKLVKDKDVNYKLVMELKNKFNIPLKTERKIRVKETKKRRYPKTRAKPGFGRKYQPKQKIIEKGAERIPIGVEPGVIIDLNELNDVIDVVAKGDENNKIIINNMIENKEPVENIKEVVEGMKVLEKKTREQKTVQGLIAERTNITKKINKLINKKKKTNKDELDLIKFNNDINEINKILESRKEQGGNIFSDIGSKVREFFSPRLDYNNLSRETKEKYGQFEVLELNIYRTPVNWLIPAALNVISFGKFAELQRKYGYDKLFHLALVATVNDGRTLKNVIMEKNEVVNISTNYATKDTTEVQNVQLRGAKFTINDILNDALRNVGNERFFLYDAFNNNCQFFIKYLLEGQGLYNQDVKNFLFQDLKDLHEELPQHVGTIAKIGTTAAAVINKLLGKGGRIEDLTDEEAKILYNYIIKKY